MLNNFIEGPKNQKSTFCMRADSIYKFLLVFFFGGGGGEENLNFKIFAIKNINNC